MTGGGMGGGSLRRGGLIGLGERRSGGSQTGNYLREIFYVFFTQKMPALVTALVIGLLTLAVAFFAPPKYQASGAFLVKAKQVETSPKSLDVQASRLMPVTTEDLNSEVKIMTSNAVLSRTVASLAQQGVIDVAVPGEEADDLAYALSLKLNTQVVPSSSVIELSLRWSDPAFARAALEALMQQYVIYRRELFQPTEVSAFLNTQVENYRNDLKAAQQRLMTLIETRDAPEPAEEIRNNLSRKSLLQQRMAELEERRLAMVGEVDLLNQKLASGDLRYFSFLDNEALGALGARVQELSLQLADLKRDFTDGAPQVVALEDQLRTLARNLRQEVADTTERRAVEIDSLDQQIALMRDRIAEIDDRNLLLKRIQLEADRIQREAALIGLSFETFFRRREEALLDQSVGDSDLGSFVTVLRKATAGGMPVFPNRGKILPVGFAAAVLGGISVAFLFHFFDPSIKRVEDVEDRLGIPVLFSLPEAQSATGVRQGKSGAAGETRAGWRSRPTRVGPWRLAGVVLLLLAGGGVVGLILVGHDGRPGVQGTGPAVPPPPAPSLLATEGGEPAAGVPDAPPSAALPSAALPSAAPPPAPVFVPAPSPAPSSVAVPAPSAESGGVREVPGLLMPPAFDPAIDVLPPAGADAAPSQ